MAWDSSWAVQSCWDCLTPFPTLFLFSKSKFSPILDISLAQKGQKTGPNAVLGASERVLMPGILLYDTTHHQL